MTAEERSMLVVENLRRRFRQMEEALADFETALANFRFEDARGLAARAEELRGALEARRLTMEEWDALATVPDYQDLRFRPQLAGGPQGWPPEADLLARVEQAQRELDNRPRGQTPPPAADQAPERDQPPPEAAAVAADAPADAAAAVRNLEPRPRAEGGQRPMPPPWPPEAPARERRLSRESRGASDPGPRHRYDRRDDLAAELLERMQEMLRRQPRHLGEFAFGNRDEFNRWAADQPLQGPRRQPRRLSPPLSPRRDERGYEPPPGYQRGAMPHRGYEQPHDWGYDRGSWYSQPPPGRYGAETLAFGGDGYDLHHLPRRPADPKIPIKAFESTGAAEWREFRQTFMDWGAAYFLTHRQAKLKLRALITGDARAVAEGVDYRVNDDRVPIDDVLSSLDDCFMSKESEAVSKAEFHTARQVAGDNVSAWFGKLKALHILGWPDCPAEKRERDSDLLEKAVMGLKDPEVRRIMKDRPTTTFSALKRETMEMEAKIATRGTSAKAVNSLEAAGPAVNAVASPARSCHLCEKTDHLWKLCPLKTKLLQLMRASTPGNRGPLGLSSQQGVFKAPRGFASRGGRGGRGYSGRGRGGRGGARPKLGIQAMDEGSTEDLDFLGAEEYDGEYEDMDAGWTEEGWDEASEESSPAPQGN